MNIYKKTTKKSLEQRPKKLLDQVREKVRLKHYSIRTEQAYVSWIKRYIMGPKAVRGPLDEPASGKMAI